MFPKRPPGIGLLRGMIRVTDAGLMKTVLIQNRRYVVDPVAPTQSHVEIVILGVDKLRAIPKLPQHFCPQAGSVDRNGPPGGLPQTTLQSVAA